jgi:ribose transport system substrate-binding protein
MRKRSSSWAAGAAILAALLVAGCSPGSATGGNDAGGGKSGKHFTIAMIPGETPLPFYDTMYRAAQQQAAKYGITIDYEGSATFGAEAQTQVLDAVLARHPDAVIVCPDDPSALTAPLEQFRAEHIPIIGVDLALADPSILVSQILGNNSQGGANAAAALGKLMGGTGTVAPLSTAQGVPTLILRENGFTAAMAKDYPDITVLPEQYAATSADAQSVARAELLAHPDLKGFFAVTEIQAEGAAAAVAALNRTNVSIATYDGDPTEVQDLEAGKIQFLSVQQPKKEGQLAVDYAYDYLTGNTAAIEKSVLIDTVPVTKANVQTPAVQAVLYSPAN